MRWAQTVRLNLSNDRQKVDSSDLNWGDSDRAKIVYSDKLTGQPETIAIDKINDSVKATMSIIENSGIEDTRADGDKSTEYIGNYIYYLLNAFYTGSELTIGDANGEDYSETTKDIQIGTLKGLPLPTTSVDNTNEMLQVHFAKNKLYFFGETQYDLNQQEGVPAKKTGIIIYKENDSNGGSSNPNTFAHTSLQYNEIKMLAEGDNTDQKLELSLDILDDDDNPIPTIELENKDNSSKPQKCMIQPDNIKVSVEDDNGDLQEDLSINNNSVDITSYSEENVPKSMSELQSNSLFFKDNMGGELDDSGKWKDIPENYENPETDLQRDVIDDRKIGDAKFYGLKISKDGIDINPNPNIEQWHEGWSSNKIQRGQAPDWAVPDDCKLYPVGWSVGHLSTGIVDPNNDVGAVSEDNKLQFTATGGEPISFLAQGNFNYYDFNLSKYCNDYFGHRNIYDTGPEYRMHVRIELVQGINYNTGQGLKKKYISFCMNINLGRWYNYTIDNQKGENLDGSGNLEVYDNGMYEDGPDFIGGNTSTRMSAETQGGLNKSKFIPSSLLNYGWDSSGAAPIINFSTNQKGLLQIPGPHITPQLGHEQGGSYFSSDDGNVTTNLSTGPDYVVTHNLHGNYVYYQRWPCKVQTDINLHSSRERTAGAARGLTGPSFNNSPGSGLTEDDYECDYWVRIIWNEYEVSGAGATPSDIDDIKLIPPQGTDPTSSTKNIQIRVTQIA
tara:strand:+ start:2620 stop:4800 length:2181 start_codon:yes stop_codon:yes gene_type:complete